ncbi:MiaB/RimO family radical SAM methylthiotransferase [bacterium]|nr:MiaB/RimO family radical SAM methylthiotransferase [bacterium]
MESFSEPLKVAFYTFGCKVNLFETDQLKKSLGNVRIVSVDEDADIFVINSCAVTATAESQARNMIRRLEKRGKVILTGCYARKIKGEICFENTEIVPDIAEVAEILGSNLRYDAFFTRSRPFIKIQSGCNQFCAYCIIPYLRGPLKSVPLGEIKGLLQKIAEEGFKEVVLTGIHIGKYGKDLNDGSTLADVVRTAYEIVGRVRMGSLESPEIDELLHDYAKNGMILPHWHIPLQSGCDKTLFDMRRPYKTDDFKRSVDKIISDYNELPAFGTDVITGFPGETDENFARTVKFIESLPFAYGHVFPFSARSGTPAELMEKENPVPKQIKKERAKILRDIFQAKKELFQKSLDGTTDDVIIEEEISENLFSSTSSKYQTVNVSGSFRPRELVRVVLSFEKGRLCGRKCP